MSTTFLPSPARSTTTVRPPRTGRWTSLLRGSQTDAAWARPALLILLALTALAYTVDLRASGYGNSFYAAAVQAGTKSWKAFFFGSIDSSNFITVDKIPGSLWIMELSGRLFGFSSLSMLIPEVLEGLAAVALLYATVRRWFGAGAGLLAGALLAMTPVAALMFRFNNPDALLVCLLVAGAYCLTRALERASTRWILAAGTMIGFAFLAKMMQAFLVLPAFGLVYAVAAPTTARRRAAQLLAGAAAIVVSAGWWVAIVALWPASSRPMIDGSSDNSIINLILGYNGLGRIFGANGSGGGSFSGSAGMFRLFNDLMGGQASWLLPAAVMILLTGLAMTWRAPRTDRTRAALLLWGGWLVVTGAVFSYSTGIIHTYYTVALTPAICALVAIGTVAVWDVRDRLAARAAFAAVVAVTAGWALVLLHRSSSWLPWLSYLIIVCAVLAIAGVLVPHGRINRRWGTLIATWAAIGCLAGPLAFAGQVVSTGHTGTTPSAGPSSATMTIGAGGSRTGMTSGSSAAVRRNASGGLTAKTTGSPPTGARSSAPTGAPSRDSAPTGGTSSSSARPSSKTGSGSRGGPPTATGRSATRATSGQVSGGPGIRNLNGKGSTQGGSSSTTTASLGTTTSQTGGGPGQITVDKSLAKTLESNASHYRWVAATSGSESAASLELATGGDPVMAIGGFNGQGGNLSLTQFKAFVAKGDIHYYVVSSTSQSSVAPGGGSSAPKTSGHGSSPRLNTGALSSHAGTRSTPGASSTSSTITAWVQAHYTSVTVGGQTVYNLTQAK